MVPEDWFDNHNFGPVASLQRTLVATSLQCREPPGSTTATSGNLMDSSAEVINGINQTLAKWSWFSFRVVPAGEAVCNFPDLWDRDPHLECAVHVNLAH